MSVSEFSVRILNRGDHRDIVQPVNLSNNPNDLMFDENEEVVDENINCGNPPTVIYEHHILTLTLSDTKLVTTSTTEKSVDMSEELEQVNRSEKSLDSTSTT